MYPDKCSRKQRLFANPFFSGSRFPFGCRETDEDDKTPDCKLRWTHVSPRLFLFTLLQLRTKLIQRGFLYLQSRWESSQHFARLSWRCEQNSLSCGHWFTFFLLLVSFSTLINVSLVICCTLLSRRQFLSVDYISGKGFPLHQNHRSLSRLPG